MFYASCTDAGPTAPERHVKKKESKQDSKIFYTRGEIDMKSNYTKIDENGNTLYGFRFIMADGTIETVWAADQFTAARIARGDR